MKQHTPIESLVKYHMWTMERAMRLLGEQSERLKLNIETCTYILDAAGWSMRLATRDAFSYLKGIADIDSAHYPERFVHGI